MTIGFVQTQGKNKKKAHPKTSGFSGLTKLQARYLVLRADRKKFRSKRAAALAAGYSRATADKAGTLIETPKVREVWQRIVDQEFSPGEVIQVLREGLHANKAIAATFEGAVTDVVLTPDHTERRKHVELISMMSGRYQRTERNQGGPTVVVPIQIVTSIPRPERG
jgi:hypothetical protein